MRLATCEIVSDGDSKFFRWNYLLEKFAAFFKGCIGQDATGGVQEIVSYEYHRYLTQ